MGRGVLSTTYRTAECPIFILREEASYISSSVFSRKFHHFGRFPKKLYDNKTAITASKQSSFARRQTSMSTWSICLLLLFPKKYFVFFRNPSLEKDYATAKCLLRKQTPSPFFSKPFKKRKAQLTDEQLPIGKHSRRHARQQEKHRKTRFIGY